MKKDPRTKRLEMELQLLEELCSNSDFIDFEIINQREGIPPDKYRIHYKVKSIIGINEGGEPIYANKHTAKITLPGGYPITSAPLCFMETNTWHPNIRAKGEAKGHICINDYVLGHWYTIDLLVKQIGEMLQYKNYHAEHIIPYPEDVEVAEWVREYAEPRKIVNKKKGIAIDNNILVKPSKKWMNSRDRKSRIKIRGIKKR